MEPYPYRQTKRGTLLFSYTDEDGNDLSVESSRSRLDEIRLSLENPPDDPSEEPLLWSPDLVDAIEPTGNAWKGYKSDYAPVTYGPAIKGLPAEGLLPYVPVPHYRGAGGGPVKSFRDGQMPLALPTMNFQDEESPPPRFRSDVGQVPLVAPSMNFGTAETPKPVHNGYGQVPLALPTMNFGEPTPEPVRQTYGQAPLVIPTMNFENANTGHQRDVQTERANDQGGRGRTRIHASGSQEILVAPKWS